MNSTTTGVSFAEAFQNNTGVQVYVGNVDDDFHGNVEVRTCEGRVFVFSGWGGVTLSCRSIAQYPAFSSGVAYETICDENVLHVFDRIGCLLQQAQQAQQVVVGRSSRPRKKATKIKTKS